MVTFHKQKSKQKAGVLSFLPRRWRFLEFKSNDSFYLLLFFTDALNLGGHIFKNHPESLEASEYRTTSGNRHVASAVHINTSESADSLSVFSSCVRRGGATHLRSRVCDFSIHRALPHFVYWIHRL